jgi:RNA polymerase sigma-70 factor (ECF subfamily)
VEEGEGADQDRWRRTFEAEQGRMWRSLYAHTGDDELAADAVSEAFAQGLRRGAAVREPTAWAWRSAFRIADGMLAEQRRGVRGRATGDELDSIAAKDTLPADVVALLDALSQLSSSDRRIVVLSLVGGLDAAEIGALVDARAGTVRVRLHRARARLQSSLAADTATLSPSRPAASPLMSPPQKGEAR